MLETDFDKEDSYCYDALMNHLRLLDALIFIIALVIIALSFVAFGELGGRPEVHVRSSGKEWVYDLSVDAFATFEGPVGKTTVQIKDNKVRVVDSDCKNKVCIATGWVSRPGQWIICLPNDVFVLIEGSSVGEDVDDTSY